AAPAGGAPPRCINDVLDPKGDAVERALGAARGDLLPGPLGLPPGLVGDYVDEAQDLRVHLLDAPEAGLHHIRGRYLLLPDPSRELVDGGVAKIIRHSGLSSDAN